MKKRACRAGSEGHERICTRWLRHARPGRHETGMGSTRWSPAQEPIAALDVHTRARGAGDLHNPSRDRSRLLRDELCVSQPRNPSRIGRWPRRDGLRRSRHRVRLRDHGRGGCDRGRPAVRRSRRGRPAGQAGQAGAERRPGSTGRSGGPGRSGAAAGVDRPVRRYGPGRPARHRPRPARARCRSRATPTGHRGRSAARDRRATARRTSAAATA